ncbi:MAG: DUF3631 domain-containing protein [Thermoleophilia bacterium]
MSRHNKDAVREAARGQWQDILAALAPGLRGAIDAGHRKHVPCPRHGGKDGLRVLDDFADTGGAVCNTCGTFADGFATIMWLCGWDFPTTVDAVGDALGMTHTNGKRPAAKPTVPVVPTSRAEGEAKKRAYAKKQLNDIWTATTKDTGRVSEYLRYRGLSGDAPPALRLHPALDYFEPDPDGPKKMRLVGTYPAMVALVQNVDGDNVNLHRTYLDKEGPGKAPVPAAKKLCTPVREGATTGAAIHLAEPSSDVLALTEGIETGLAVQEATGLAVWACVSAGGLEAGQLPPTVRRVYIWADRDESGRGLKAAEKAATRFTAEGREVLVLIPPRLHEEGAKGTDWLDVLNAQGATVLQEAHKAAQLWTPEMVAQEPVDDDVLFEAELDRLASLSTLAYERERTEAAKMLKLRASVLDTEVRDRQEANHESQGLFLEDPELWPEPVDGAALLNELVTTAKRHVSLPAGAAEAMALWVLHTHAHDAAEVSPILGVTSPTPECGKSTLLTFSQAVVSRPLPTSNITAACLFRTVEKYAPTLLIDEADTFLRDNDDLRGILNSGHARAGAFVLRTVGDDYEPKMFKTWSPKAIALIGKLPPTLASRSIHVELKRLAPGECVTPLRLHQVGVLIPLQRKAARWASDHLDALRTHEPELPPELYGRAADNWRPLLSLADLAGGDWPQRARLAAVTLSAVGSEQTAGILLLEDLRRLFEGQDKLTTVEILAALNAMDDRPWPEWSRGKELTSRGLGKLLTPFKITSRNIRSDAGVLKGYQEEQFADTFRRYLPPCVSATPLQPGVHAGLRDSASATCSEDVADSNKLFSAVESHCSVVADSEPPQEGEDASLPESLPSDPAFADEAPEPFTTTTAPDGSRLVAL